MEMKGQTTVGWGGRRHEQLDSGQPTTTNATAAVAAVGTIYQLK